MQVWLLCREIESNARSIKQHYLSLGWVRLPISKILMISADQHTINRCVSIKQNNTFKKANYISGDVSIETFWQKLDFIPASCNLNLTMFRHNTHTFYFQELKLVLFSLLCYTTRKVLTLNLHLPEAETRKAKKYAKYMWWINY